MRTFYLPSHEEQHFHDVLMKYIWIIWKIIRKQFPSTRQKHSVSSSSLSTHRLVVKFFVYEKVKRAIFYTSSNFYTVWESMEKFTCFKTLLKMRKKETSKFDERKKKIRYATDECAKSRKMILSVFRTVNLEEELCRARAPTEHESSLNASNNVQFCDKIDWIVPSE